MAHHITVEYFRRQLDLGNQLLENEAYREVLRRIFILGNNEHSGWTPEVDELYRAPSTEEEKALVEQMKQLLRQTIEGLVPTLVASAAFFDYVEIASCVNLLRLLNSPEVNEKQGSEINAKIEAATQLPMNPKIKSYYFATQTILQSYLSESATSASPQS